MYFDWHFELEMITQLNPLLTEFRQALTQHYGDRLSRIILYGSQARNDTHEDSDVDIVIVLSQMESAGDEILGLGDIQNQLCLKYDQLISILPVSESDYLYKQTPLLKNVRNEGIVL